MLLEGSILFSGPSFPSTEDCYRGLTVAFGADDELVAEERLDLVCYAGDDIFLDGSQYWLV